MIEFFESFTNSNLKPILIGLGILFVLVILGLASMVGFNFV